MAQARYYSPRLERALISRLYHQAKAERIPMTTLANRLIRIGLAPEPQVISNRLAEDPPAHDPSKRSMK